MGSSKPAVSMALKIFVCLGLASACLLTIGAALLTAKIQVLHERPPAPTADQEPPPPGPVPEVCKDWVSPPPSREVRPSEADARLEPGEREEGLNCFSATTHDGGSSAICYFKSIENASEYALLHLYAKDRHGLRAPHGGGVDCERPLTADWVTCHVNVTDVNFNMVEVVKLSCPGLHNYPERCKLAGREKTFAPYVPPTKAEMERFEEELRQNRERRYRTCRPYCLHPKYEGQCSKYWDHI